MILSLLNPFYIPRLDFKSREELQLMPQTEEEYLIALEDEIEDSESEQSASVEHDVEVFPAE